MGEARDAIWWAKRLHDTAQAALPQVSGPEFHALHVALSEFRDRVRELEDAWKRRKEARHGE